MNSSMNPAKPGRYRRIYEPGKRNYRGNNTEKVIRTQRQIQKPVIGGVYAAFDLGTVGDGKVDRTA